MSNNRAELLRSAMNLSEDERVLLATEIMETVEDEIGLWSLNDPELIAELERRDADGTAGIPWETVRAKLQADLDA